MNSRFSLLVCAIVLCCTSSGHAESTQPILAGLARVEITPELPIRLAGYAHRTKPADHIDAPLIAQALALKNPDGRRFVLLTVDNCEVSGALFEPVLSDLLSKHGMEPGSIALVSSHSHSAPVLAHTLVGMPPAPSSDQSAIVSYSQKLQGYLKKVVDEALAKFEPVNLEYGTGRCTFAMNRRVYRDGKVGFGDNPDGPVDWDVPVLRVLGTNRTVRAIVFGYACHGTSVRDGDDFYAVSPEYMGYARQWIESVHPGAMAMYVPGFGADSDPSPRGKLAHAKQHGLELAGAVAGVLSHPMRQVEGSLDLKFKQLDLALSDAPGREQIEKEAQSTDSGTKQRASVYLQKLRDGEPIPKSVKLPVSVLKIGTDLTMVFMGGEVVVDYSRRLKRLLNEHHPWLIAYAYDVPCYIPSFRIIKEGGYEAESSLAFYGVYGPFKNDIEEKIVAEVVSLTNGQR